MIAIVILGFTVVIAGVVGRFAVNAFDVFNDPIVNRMCFRQDAMEQDMIRLFNEHGKELPEWVKEASLNHGKHWRDRKRIVC